MVEDEELELRQGMESSFSRGDERRSEKERANEQRSMSAWSLGFCRASFAALGAELEEVGVGGQVIQINSVMSNQEEEEEEFGEAVIILKDGTEEEKGRRLEGYQKPF